MKFQKITNQMPTNHNKYKTIQHKIREKESLQITINTEQKFHHGYGFGLEQRLREKGGEA